MLNPVKENSARENVKQYIEMCTTVLLAEKLPMYCKVHRKAMLCVMRRNSKTLQNITHVRLSCCANTRKHCKMPFIWGLSLAGVSNGTEREAQAQYLTHYIYLKLFWMSPMESIV